MNFYKHPNGKVFAFDDNQVESGCVPDNLFDMSQDEINRHLNPDPEPLTKEQVNVNRLLAYADPITGSDRFRAEAYAETQAGNVEAAEIANQAMLSRREEIKLENPWPESE